MDQSAEGHCFRFHFLYKYINLHIINYNVFITNTTKVRSYKKADNFEI